MLSEALIDYSCLSTLSGLYLRGSYVLECVRIPRKLASLLEAALTPGIRSTGNPGEMSGTIMFAGISCFVKKKESSGSCSRLSSMSMLMASRSPK